MAANTPSSHDESDKKLKYIINELKNNRQFYESDYFTEYSPFERSLKEFFDVNVITCLEKKEYDYVFYVLTSIIDTLGEIETKCYYEDLFRPVEIITYFFGKLIIISDDSMKKKIYEWIKEYVDENEDTMISFEYFKPFIEGYGIYHSDEYYTDYDDFDDCVLVFNG